MEEENVEAIDNVDDLDMFGNDQDILDRAFANDSSGVNWELDGFSFPGDEKDFN